MLIVRFIVIASLLFFLACSSTPALTVSGFDLADPNVDNNANKLDSIQNENCEKNYKGNTDKKYSILNAIEDVNGFPDNEVLFSILNDKIALNFYPKYYIERPPLPNKTPFQQVDDKINDHTEQEKLNPIIAKINNEPVRAVAFTNRMFQRHRERFEFFIKELFVDAVAKTEAKKEGIFFTPRQLRNANMQVMKFLRGRSRKIGKSFEENWREQGFETEKAYVDAMKKHTARMILLEHLIFLDNLRTDKAEYSHILLSDKPDNFNPNPMKKARQVADKLNKALLSWNDAVKKYSQDSRTVKNNGKVGLIFKDSTGMKEIENFIFSHKQGSISNPIKTIYGLQIIRIDKLIPGKKNAKYEDLVFQIEDELKKLYKIHIAGVRITAQDTFNWLENILRKKKYHLRLFYPRYLKYLPNIASVNEEKIAAGKYFVHSFESKPEWAKQTMSEILIFELAKRETKYEKITIPKEKFDEAVKNVIEYLKDETSTKNKNLAVKNETKSKGQNEIWQKLNYPDKKSFVETIQKLTLEAMQIERLILLHDARAERIKLFHILLRNEDQAYTVRKLVFDENKVQKSIPKSFSNVARRFSLHKKSRRRGGLLGTVPRGTYSKEFEDRAFRLRINQISQPFETKQGWHLLLVTEKYPANPNGTYIQLKNEINKTLKERGNVPGKRVSTGDMFRWVAYIMSTNRYDIKTYIPNFTNFKPEAPKEKDKDNPASKTGD